MAAGERLPPERDLCAMLGVSRGELRKALAVLEREEKVWRHVGKGTFVGARPVTSPISVGDVASRSNPGEVMRARLVLEPALAREAALNATSADLDEMKRILVASRKATTWRQYETCDNRFHRAVAEAARNVVLTALFDELNAIRRTVVWGRLRTDRERPPPNHHSFVQHDRIMDAIAERNVSAAGEAMAEHIESVLENLLKRQQNPGRE